MFEKVNREHLAFFVKTQNSANLTADPTKMGMFDLDGLILDVL
jgi:hypothetical protein